MKKNLGHIKDACVVIAGQSPKGSSYNEEGKGMEFHQGKKAFGETMLESSGVWTTEITKLAEPGDILMSVRAPVGPTNMTDRKVCIGRGLAAIRCSDKVIPQFILYALRNIESMIVGNDGAVFNSINKNMIEDLPLPIVPLSEQSSIVSYLDSAFAKIDALKSNAEKELEEAKALFLAKQKEILRPKEGWVVSTLKDECFKITDGTHQTPKYFEKGYIFLSSKNVTSRKIDWNDVKYIDEAQHNVMYKRVAPKVGDILLAKNGTTGVAAMVDRDVVFDIYVSLALLRTIGNVSPDYLLAYVNSPMAKEQFDKRLIGMGVPNLHLGEINQVTIPYPIDKDEQVKITSKLNDLDNSITDLRSNYSQIISECSALKQAILREVFE